MPLSPESSDRLRRIALAGTALAIAGIAFKNNKVIGDKIRHASFWEASQSVIVDLIDDSKKRMVRLAGIVVRDANNEVVDVKNVELLGTDRPEEVIPELEDAFDILRDTETS